MEKELELEVKLRSETAERIRGRPAADWLMTVHVAGVQKKAEAGFTFTS